MRLRSSIMLAVSWVTPSIALSVSDLLAQSVTTASIRGTVHTADGSDVDGARVSVVNTSTGFGSQRDVRDGRFLVSGLPIGGPYTVTLQRAGYRTERREAVFLGLGEALEMRFVMQSAAVPLAPVEVAVSRFPRVNEDGGTATLISDSLLHRLPSLNRNLYDFVRLAPQVSTRIGFAAAGLSGGGVGFRFNNFLVNGVPQRSVPGGQPPEFAGLMSVPLDAVSEYQVLLAPFDVRYGDFAGALVNVVTRSGTNRLHGSVFAYGRNDALARSRGNEGSSPYDRRQYGISLGGPIVRDRAHFYIATELQEVVSPAPGPHVGQPVTATRPVPVSSADLDRLEQIMSGYGLVSGSGGPVENSNPLTSIFGQVDINLPEWNSRAVLWMNATRASNLNFRRDAHEDFPLSTHAATQSSDLRTAALQLHTALRRGGGHNELLVSYRSGDGRSSADVQQPIVRVAVPSSTGGAVTIVTGAPQHAHGLGAGFHAISLRNDLTLPVRGAHVAAVGFEVERFQADRRGVANSFGSWSFSSLDSLELGVAESYSMARDFGSASVPLRGGHYAAYAGDRWSTGERLSITMGIRAEVLALDGRAPYNPVVDSIFGRRTDRMPAPRIHWSPRVGVTWDPRGTGRQQLRGGIGFFTGRPPIAWMHPALQSYGVGIGRLSCGRLPTDAGPPPAFSPDPAVPPAECANGFAISADPRGDVDLLANNLRMAQTLRGVLAFERRLPLGLFGTLEALLTRNLSDFVFVNFNLREPRGVDAHGRVLYGTIGPTGLAAPDQRSEFSEVIDLQNTSGNKAYQLSARLDKRFFEGSAATAYYTFSRVRDLQTPLRVNVQGIVNWSSRAVSGRHDEMSPGISVNDIPHRLMLAGTHRAPWRHWVSEISFYYVAESGSPFTYLAWGDRRGRGDLNADGSSGNDPIYVPYDALDGTEMHFASLTREVELPGGDTRSDSITPAQQAQAFGRFIDRTPCLSRQRGQIMKRNSCREPWSHTAIVSARQAIPVAGRTVEAQLDVYNLLNLLSSSWGHTRIAAPALLEHVGQTPGPLEESQPIFRFDEMAPRWTTLPAESAFQLQFGLRYRF
jgi:hypothetical protein